MLVLTQHGPVHLKAVLRGLTSSESWSQSQHVPLCQRVNLAIRPHRLSRRFHSASCVVYLGLGSLWRGIRYLYPATDYVVRYRGLNLTFTNKLLIISLSCFSVPNLTLLSHGTTDAPGLLPGFPSLSGRRGTNQHAPTPCLYQSITHG